MNCRQWIYILLTMISFNVFALDDERIEELENFSTCSYKDAHGYSVGFGQQIIDNKRVIKGQCITREHALLNLYHKLDIINTQLNQWLKANNSTLNINQHDAILLFIYNIGFSGFKHSSVAWAIEYNKKQVVTNMLQYRTSNGKILEGLEKRRAYEGKLFNTKVKK